MMNRCSSGCADQHIWLVLLAVRILYHSIPWERLCRYRAFHTSWYDPNNPSGHRRSHCYLSCFTARALSGSSILMLGAACVATSCSKPNLILLFVSTVLVVVFLKRPTNFDLCWWAFWLYRQLALRWIQVLFSCSLVISLLKSPL